MPTKKRKPAPSLGILPAKWFALVHDPTDRPDIYGSERLANLDRLPGEYVVEVYIHAVHLKDVAKARRWQLQQAKAFKRRPMGIKVKGVNLLREALKKVTPTVQRSFHDAIQKHVKAMAQDREARLPKRRVR